MLELSGKLRELDGLGANAPRSLLRVVTNAALPKVLASDAAFLCQSAEVPAGFRFYMALHSNRTYLEGVPAGAPRAVLPDSASFLGEGDIVRLSPSSGSYRVVFRSRSNHVSILLTERCNHYCLMCSQPPREVNDDWIMEEVEKLIPMIPMHTREIGFTGGEPTLYGERFIRLLERTRTYLPRTAVHVLSNGRRFSDLSFSKAYAAVKHPDLMVGIPIYSDDPVRHNYVVQAEGAFDETIQGILNLKRLKQRVELRVVLHLQTIDRLTNLAEFIARNLLFVDQVALMGLEITGFTRGNLDKLWIDPYDYRDTLARTVDILSAYKVPTAVYNHQLCVVSERVRRFCTRSISDWKNEYLPVCSSCALRGECGGFFSSGVKYRHSDYIHPIAAA
jgi:His-Xaa-Ser system radical SAM maturase HxsC